MTTPQLTVILPTYNERESIQPLILAIWQGIKPPPEIIVVDDDSPDKTWEVVAELQNQVPQLKLHRRRERGLATAIAEGITLSTGDVLTWMDCDFSHPPTLIPQMLKALEDCDIVVASRYVKGGRGGEPPFIRTITSRLFNLYANLWLGFSVKDWTSGFPMVKRELLQKVKIEPLGQGYGEYFVGLMFSALKKGFKIKEIAYTYVYNSDHGTKTSPNLAKLLSFGVSYGLCVPQLRWRALRGRL